MPTPFRQGERVGHGGQYRIDRKLGDGGFGENLQGGQLDHRR